MTDRLMTVWHLVWWLGIGAMLASLALLADKVQWNYVNSTLGFFTYMAVAIVWAFIHSTMGSKLSSHAKEEV